MEKMTFGKAIKTCLSKYAVFTGRARRAEYWYFVLFMVLVSWALSIWSSVKLLPLFLLDGPGAADAWTNPFEILKLGGAPMIISGIFSLAMLLPSLAVFVRRLHDTNHSGWWVLAFYLFYIVDLVLLVFFSVYVVQMSGAMSGALYAVIFLVLSLGLLAFAIVLLVWLCTAGTVGPNKYGPDPKASPEEKPVVDVPFTVTPQEPEPAQEE